MKDIKKRNEPGNYCWREGILCEHNLIDSWQYKGIFICSQHTNGQCIKGSEYSFPPSQMKNRRDIKCS